LIERQVEPSRERIAFVVVPGALLLLHVATISGYGYFRDELYYLACGCHPGFGYVDHPPLIGFVAAAVRAVLGESLWAIRLLPAIAHAATVALGAELARTLGGRRWAQIAAAATIACAPIYVSLFSIFSMNAFDVAIWATALVIVARILRAGDDRGWLAFGLVCGVGLENKISVLFLGFGLVLGLLIAGPRATLLRRPVWIAGAIALALFLPHLIWQQVHGWPTLEFMERARTLKNLPLSPLDFLEEQVLHAGPLALPVWVAGLGYLLVARRARPFRALGWAWMAILVLLIVARGKAYYFAPVHVLSLAAGGVALESWSHAIAPVARRLALGAAIAGGLITAPLAKALLPVDSYVRYAAALGVAPSTGERQRLGRLPQFFADMHGWPELARTVADVWSTLDAEERTEACIFGQNYGEAAAIDRFGPALGLPPSISAHNSYFLWGPRDCTGAVVVVIGDDRETLASLFASVELGATHVCADCMPYESDLPIWVARGLKQPIAELWPRIKSYI
jgi:Dolichyl-phosphate-mannose-protein mannosyltransferase